MKSIFSILILISVPIFLFSQFSLADSLRGQLRPERTCYDVKFYDLNLDINFETKHIKGFNKIVYKVVRGFNMLQIDLFSNMEIDSIIHSGKNLKFYPSSLFRLYITTLTITMIFYLDFH